MKTIQWIVTGYSPITEFNYTGVFRTEDEAKQYAREIKDEGVADYSMQKALDCRVWGKFKSYLNKEKYNEAVGKWSHVSRGEH